MSRKFLVGVFKQEESLLKACRRVREEGLSIHDTYTPYAVHGLEEAMGLRRSRLSIVCFLLGLTGLTVALGFQLWATAVNWPINIGGKSHSAVPALIPITFELTILFAAVGTVVALFIRAGLWPGRRAELLDVRATDDRFVLALEHPGTDGATTMFELLQEQGADEIREVEITS